MEDIATEYTGRLVLASGSPRRREIMQRAGMEFTIDVSEFDESQYSYIDDPRRLVLQLAYEKAAEVWRRHERDVIVAADTVVYDGEILGKPRDISDARRMISQLSGHSHQVLTGVCVMSGGVTRLHCEVTQVAFKPLAPETIDEYVATGEPLGKAGAYAIQGAGGALVESYDGDYDNIVGLPLRALKEMLALKP